MHASDSTTDGHQLRNEVHTLYNTCDDGDGDSPGWQEAARGTQRPSGHSVSSSKHTDPADSRRPAHDHTAVSTRDHRGRVKGRGAKGVLTEVGVLVTAVGAVRVRVAQQVRRDALVVAAPAGTRAGVRGRRAAGSGGGAAGAHRNMGGWQAVTAQTAALSSPASAQSARPSQRQAGGRQRVRAPARQARRAPHSVPLPACSEQNASSEPSPQSVSPSHHHSLQHVAARARNNRPFRSLMALLLRGDAHEREESQKEIIS